MFNFKSIAAVAAVVFAAGSATAATIDVSGNATYSDVVPRDPGVYGAEIRGGRDGARDWELGVGVHTSVAGSFSQSEYTWDGTNTPVSFTYDYGLTTANVASLTVDGVVTSFDFGTMEFGNTIRLFAKRTAGVIVESITAGGSTEAVSFNATGNPANAFDPNSTILLFNEDFTSGFSLSGTLFVQGGGGSANEVFIAAGDIAPIPLPAAAWMLLAGVGGLGVIARRKRAAA